MTEQNESQNSQPSKLQEAYDRTYKSEDLGIDPLNLSRWPRNRWEALVHSMPPHARNVLEIGCGNGVVLSHIADRCEALTGMEFSANRCEVARRNLEGLDIPVKIMQGNLEHGIDEQDGSFDVILWADVIEHVVDVFSAMREVSRLLARGGILVTSTPNMAYIRYRLALLFGKFPGTSARDEGFAVRPGELYDGGHLHYFTVSTLKRLYRMNGIEPTQVEGFGRLGKLHNLYPNMLSGAAHVVGKKG